jgi:hypothetical protein
MTDEDELSAVRRRFPVGATVEGTVERVFAGNREFTVLFPGGWEVVEYEGAPPAVGSAVSLVVVRLLEWSYTIVLRPGSAAEAARQDRAARS